MDLKRELFNQSECAPGFNVLTTVANGFGTFCLNIYNVVFVMNIIL